MAAQEEGREDVHLGTAERKAGVDARFLTAVLREMCLHRGLLKRVNFYKSCCMRPSEASRRAGSEAAVGAARPGLGPAAATRAGGHWEPFLSIKWRQ